ncbi:MAG: S1 RNA-binding domain-containing protein [Anaerolineae bacterium]
METQEVVDVRVVGFNKGGLLADFGRITGFIPQSHITRIPRGTTGEELIREKEALKGDYLSVVVIEVNRMRNRLVLSEREARSAVRRARIDELEEGQIVTGRVVGLVDYGAFVDIGGIDGLIHISNLDTRYVRHPSDFLDTGDEVTVRIDSIDVDRERINLNRKVLMPDPWDTVEEHYKPGDVVDGIVTNIVDFGVFVALPHGFEGLVHASEMETYMPNEPLEAGLPLRVRVLEIDQSQQRISLSLDAVPSEERQNVAEDVDLNQMEFDLEPGLTPEELDHAPAASEYDDEDYEEYTAPSDYEPGTSSTTGMEQPTA